MNAFRLFSLYHAFHLHFSSKSYDILKYGGKTRCNAETFSRRRDFSRWQQIGNKFSSIPEFTDWTLSNFVYGEKGFIYKPFQETFDVKTRWTRVRDSLTKIVGDELSEISVMVEGRSLEEIKIGKNNYPPLLQIILKDLILPETCIIIDRVSPFIDDWEQEFSLDQHWQEIAFKLKKYRPFVKMSDEKAIKLVERIK